MSIKLKIKGMTLAQEARIIRRHEQRLKRMKATRYKPTPALREPPDEVLRSVLREMRGVIEGTNPKAYKAWGNAELRSLQAHRRGPVRHEARLTHLARMFLKDTPYKAAEAKVHESNRLSDGDWTAIQRMAERYARYGNGPRQFISPQHLAQQFEEWRTTASNEDQASGEPEPTPAPALP